MRDAVGVQRSARRLRFSTRTAAERRLSPTWTPAPPWPSPPPAPPPPSPPPPPTLTARGAVTAPPHRISAWLYRLLVFPSPFREYASLCHVCAAALTAQHKRRYKYLLLIPPPSYAEIFKIEISPTLLGAMIDVLSAHCPAEGACYAAASALMRPHTRLPPTATSHLSPRVPHDTCLAQGRRRRGTCVRCWRRYRRRGASL